MMEACVLQQWYWGCVAKDNKHTLHGIRSEAFHVDENLGMRAKKSTLLCKQGLCRFSWFVHTGVLVL